MIRIDAVPYLAKVVNLEPFRDLPFVKLVRDAVRLSYPERAAYPNLAIAVGIDTPLPEPASLGFFHFGQKAIFCWQTITSHNHASPCELLTRVGVYSFGLY